MCSSDTEYADALILDFQLPDCESKFMLFINHVECDRSQNDYLVTDYFLSKWLKITRGYA